jgi:tetratricopeptide (TPR) repeat protein
MSDITNHGPIKNQLIGNHFLGPVTINGNTVIYQKAQLPRRLTAIPTLQSTLIGRDTDLENLANSLNTNQTVALVRGMGGVGKTTLATAYIQREIASLTHVIWITQTTDFATSLLATDNLPATLGIPITDNPTADAQNLLRQLSTLAGPSLLVIDNAEPDVDHFLPYLPGAPNWKVLITARKTLRVPTNLQLDNLKTEDAIALFQDHYTFQDDETVIRAIITDVGGHALTIELLAKTAQKLKLSLPKFYDTLQQRGLAINRQANVPVAHAGTREVPKVFPYLLAIFEMSDLPEAAQRLLYQFTILPTDFIAFDSLQTIFQLDPDREAAWDNFNLNLDVLTKAGWLTHDPAQGYRIHQVIQEVVQEKLKDTFPQDLLDQVLSGVTTIIRFDENQDNPATMLDELAFGDAVLDQLSNFPNNSKRSSFLDRLATLLAVFGRYNEAVNNFEKALTIDLALNGEAHPTVQTRRSNLANVYDNQGKYPEAAVLLEKALQYDIDHFGEIHPNVQISRSNLANVYRNQGKYPEAAALLEKALRYEIDHFGETHPTVQTSRSNLANVYHNQGKYSEAVVLLEKALQYGIDHFGETHPNVQTRRSNLANVYVPQGKYTEAAVLLEKALQYDIDHFGETHPNVQNRRSNLAVNLYHQKDYNSALSFAQTAHDYLSAHQGPDHPNVISIAKTLSIIRAAATK